jgi:hypothetical protein
MGCDVVNNIIFKGNKQESERRGEREERRARRRERERFLELGSSSNFCESTTHHFHQDISVKQKTKTKIKMITKRLHLHDNGTIMER